VVDGVIMAFFLDAIQNVGIHRFKSDARGRRCRGWFVDLLALFLQLGLVQVATRNVY
jgi:hypothetical protein